MSAQASLPKKLTNMFKPLECLLCNVACSTATVAEAHYLGKHHKKNVKNFLLKHNLEMPNEDKPKAKYKPARCDICNVVLSSLIVLKQHLDGKSHRRNAKKLVLSDTPTSSTSGPEWKFFRPPEPPTLRSEYCHVCNIRIGGSEHFDSIIHKTAVEGFRKEEESEPHGGEETSAIEQKYDTKSKSLSVFQKYKAFRKALNSRVESEPKPVKGKSEKKPMEPVKRKTWLPDCSEASDELRDLIVELKRKQGEVVEVEPKRKKCQKRHRKDKKTEKRRRL